MSNNQAILYALASFFIGIALGFAVCLKVTDVERTGNWSFEKVQLPGPDPFIWQELMGDE